MSELGSALARLYARIPLGVRLGLDAMRGACARFDHPERAWPAAVHVAGTNGKGSVCAMVESIARAHGLRTGMYTSPHLCRFAERIRVDGEPLGDQALGALLDRVLGATPDLSFFETATLAAFVAFREARVDLAVVEVGIGGRLDATNVLPCPRAAAITRIALDHTDRLGPTMVDIAREKAGIAKPGLDLVLGRMPSDARAAIDDVARGGGATTSTIDDAAAVPSRIGLAGEHQRDNARIASVLAARIGCSPRAIEEGIARVRWPGRLERIDALGARFLLDAAHNPDGAEALARHLRTLAIDPARVALVFGTLGDKAWQPMLDALAPLASTRVYVAPHGGVRVSTDPHAFAARHSGTVAESLDEALTLATRATGRDPSHHVIVAGSIYLVGEARALLLGLPRDPPVAL